MNWIDDVVEASSEAETPRSWIEWAALAAIAAAASNNVYMNKKGVYQLRSNMFVMLMGRSGLGKGFPVNMAKKLVRMTNSTRVIGGRGSIQGVIAEMGKQSTNEDRTAPIKDSRLFLCASEWSSSLVEDPQALPILTDLYDCHWNEEWPNILKMGHEKIIQPHLTILSGSNVVQFFRSIKQSDIEGGFIGRLIMVYEETRARVNPLMSDVIGEEGEDINFPYEKLSKHLINITQEAKGRFQWSREAASTYRAWYTKFRNLKSEDKTGQGDRLHDHACKVAMNLSLAESTDLVIRESHISEAIEKVQGVTFATKRITHGKGADPLSDQLKMVFEYIIRAGKEGIIRQKLLAKGVGDYDAPMMDRLTEQLIEIGWVDKERFSYQKKNGQIAWDYVYKISEIGVNLYLQKRKEVGDDD